MEIVKKLGVWHFIAILNNGFRKPRNYFFHIHDIIFDYTHDLIHENMIIQENFGSGGWALMKCYIYFSTPHAHPNGFIEHLVQKHLFNLSVILRGRWQHVKGTNGSLLGIRLYLKKRATFSKRHASIPFTSHVGPASRVDPLRPINYNTSGVWNLNKFKPSHLAILRLLSFGVIDSHTVCVSGVIKMNTCTIIQMRNILLDNKKNKTKLISNVAKNYPVRTSRVMSVVVVAQQRTPVARMQTCIFLRNVCFSF